MPSSSSPSSKQRLYLKLCTKGDCGVRVSRTALHPISGPACCAFRWCRQDLEGCDYPSHRSSQSIATLTGSVLHSFVTEFQPVHGSITCFRVLRKKLMIYFTHDFSTPTKIFLLKLASFLNLLTHHAKGTPSDFLKSSDCL